MPTAPMIVFTDLDGTLLDHDSYSYAPALPALARLKAAGVPVVLASSKTATELAALRDEMGLSDVPAIVENGAGVLAAGAVPGAGHAAYARLRQALDALPASLRSGFEGFGDWGPERIAGVTGLPLPAARNAAKRQFSEPGLWQGADADRPAFLDALSAAGITAREGGRFLTLSFGGTKADQMDRIAASYGSPFRVALGDAPNDVEMLTRADLGIVIANPHRTPLPPLAGEAENSIRRTELPGPEGWNAALGAVIVERGL